jgi:hypothetical protein
MGALPVSLAQTQAMHDAANMVGVVAYREAHKNSVGETRGGPTIAVETSGPRAGTVQFGDIGKLD